MAKSEQGQRVTATDFVMALIAFAFFAGFLGIIIFSVQHTALIIVSLIGIALAAYDFASQLWRSRR